MLIKNCNVFQKNPMIKFLLVLTIQATLFLKEPTLALDFTNENKNFIQKCLIPQLNINALQRKDFPNIEELSYYSSFPQLLNLHNKNFKTPISAAVDLLTTVELLGITEQTWNSIYFKDNDDCLHQYFTTLAKHYKLDVDNLFQNIMRFASTGIRKESHNLTQSKMNFFILFFTPKHDSFFGFSWSHVYGTTVLTVPLSREEFLKDYNSESESKIIKRLVQDLDRQFIHEYFIKRDAAQTIGVGGYRTLEEPFKAELKMIDQDLSPLELKILNDKKARYALSHYRAAQFEFRKGIGEEIPDLKCSEIIKKYNFNLFFDPNPENYEAYLLRPRVTNWLIDHQNNQINIFNLQEAVTNLIKTIQSLPRDYTALDRNEKLCKILKTPLLQEGKNLPLLTEGPGCVSCASGW